MNLFVELLKLLPKDTHSGEERANAEDNSSPGSQPKFAAYFRVSSHTACVS